MKLEERNNLTHEHWQKVWLRNTTINYEIIKKLKESGRLYALEEELKVGAISPCLILGRGSSLEDLDKLKIQMPIMNYPF